MAVDAGLGQAIGPGLGQPMGLGGAAQGPSGGPQGVPGLNGPIQGAPNMRDLLAGSHEAFEQAQAQHVKLEEASARLDAARKTLDKLADLGDTVTADDVVEASAHLVGHGFDPKSLAEMLSSMPMQGGQALQGWITQHDAQLTKLEASMKPALAQSTQHLAGRAMASLHLSHLEQVKGPSPNPPGALNTPISAAFGATGGAPNA